MGSLLCYQPICRGRTIRAHETSEHPEDGHPRVEGEDRQVDGVERQVKGEDRQVEGEDTGEGGRCPICVFIFALAGQSL